MLDQLGNGLLLGIIISVASVALSLLYGVTRIVNFAHGEIIALGAIATLFFSSPLDYRVLFLEKFSPLGLNFAISCFLAILVCGLFGGLFGGGNNNSASTLDLSFPELPTTQVGQEIPSGINNLGNLF